jgi:hypothetical protein
MLRGGNKMVAVVDQRTNKVDKAKKETVSLINNTGASSGSRDAVYSYFVYSLYCGEMESGMYLCKSTISTWLCVYMSCSCKFFKSSQ